MVLVRLEMMLQTTRCGAQPVPIEKDPIVVEFFAKIEGNLERLNLDILEIGIDDLPPYYYRHTIGVLGRIECLLR